MTRRLWSLVFVSIMVASVAYAGGNLDTTPRSAAPMPIPVSGPSVLGSPALACATVYSALLPTGAQFLPLDAPSPISGTPYTEYGDDLHLVAGGVLCDFSFTYFEPGTVPIDIVITIYNNDPGDGVLGAPVAGPYLLAGAPPGLVTLNVSPGDTPVIGPDVWFSISGVNTIRHGLVIAGGPPTTGVSHDLFLDVPNFGWVFFGGNPVANFNIELNVDGTVATEVSTWGKIKSIYEEE